MRRVCILFATVVAAATLGPGVAQASHDDGRRLCSQKFDGTFKHLNKLPLYRNGPGSTRVGRLSVNFQWRRQGRLYRVCAVTIRRWHRKPRYTSVSLARNGVPYRYDSGMFWRYAGPIVRGLRAGQRLHGTGRVARACASFRVTWPADGRPYLDGGGCA